MLVVSSRSRVRGFPFLHNTLHNTRRYSLLWSRTRSRFTRTLAERFLHCRRSGGRGDLLNGLARDSHRQLYVPYPGGDANLYLCRCDKREGDSICPAGSRADSFEPLRRIYILRHRVAARRARAQMPLLLSRPFSELACVATTFPVHVGRNLSIQQVALVVSAEGLFVRAEARPRLSRFDERV